MPPRQPLSARLEDLTAELEALRLFRRQRLITNKRKYDTQRAKLLRAIQEIRDQIDQQRRSREIAQQIAERERKAREKKEKAQRKKQFLTTLRRNFASGRRFTISFGNNFISDAEILDFIARVPGRWKISAGNEFYFLNDNTRIKFRQLVENNLVVTETSSESDGYWNVWINDLGEITVEPFQENQDFRGYAFLEGAFFKWTNKTFYNFYRYGIYTKDDMYGYYDVDGTFHEKVSDKDKCVYDENCLILAFRMWGMDILQLEHLKTFVKNRSVPKKDLKEIAKKLKVKIVLKTSNDEKTKHGATVFGKEFEKTIHIGLIESHYFLIEPTNVTRYALEHYWDIWNLPESNHIIAKRGRRYERDAKRCVDSYDLVKILLEHKESLLEEVSFDDQWVASTQFYDKSNKEITTLEYSNTLHPILKQNIQDGEETYLYKGKLLDCNFQNVFFDFETYVQEGKHVPYLCCSYDGTNKQFFVGEDCGLQLLKSLPGNTRLIAHNASYDYRFIIEYLTDIQELSRGQRLITCKAMFKDKCIQIKDSLHLIAKPLRDFPSMFGLDSPKEVMFYNFFTKETIAKRHHKPIDIEPYLKESEKAQFYENLKKWKLIDQEGKFDIIAYSLKYCEIDCQILCNGYNTFRKWLLDLVKIDINRVFTIASLAHRYFIQQDCYDGVYELNGVPQLYIQGSVVGGRTMCAENKKLKVEGKLSDFDAVSLYPSAMRRMHGFLKGTPKVLTNLSYEFLKQQDGYFIDIQITGVKINRKFPLMSYKNEEGVRIFTNDMVGKVIRVDRYTLEDLIEFQGVTFEVLRGYYFNEGFNNKINEVIKFLFDERLRMKKEGNPAQEVYKLIMNSGYGKSIMKPVEAETKFFDSERSCDRWLSRHYNWVIEATRFGTKTKVKFVKTLDEHKNIAHVGTMILSMSKRLMNEVMCLAEDNELDIYYQDTDSMHILDEAITVLATKFQEKYGRQLIGKEFGQFHSDFDLPGATDVYSHRAIFLGKKAYINELVGKNKNGEEMIGYHIRLKGVPNDVVLETAKSNGFANPFEMFETLYTGKSIPFDLTNNGKRANFQFNKDYTVNTLSYFVRTIQFA